MSTTTAILRRGRKDSMYQSWLVSDHEMERTIDDWLPFWLQLHISTIMGLEASLVPGYLDLIILDLFLPAYLLKESIGETLIEHARSPSPATPHKARTAAEIRQ